MADPYLTFRCCRHCRHHRKLDRAPAPGGHFTPCRQRAACKGAGRVDHELRRPAMFRLATLLNLFTIR